MLLAVVATGIERDATSIDSAELSYQYLKEMSITKGVVRVERAVYGESGWAIRAALGAGRATHSGSGSPEVWYVSGGLKRVLTDYTSVSFLLDYEWVSGGDEYQVVAGRVDVLQRLLPTDRPLSPYLRGAVSIADARIPTWGTAATEPDVFTALVLQLGVGCDFALSAECSMVAEVTYRDSSGLTDGAFGEQYADGYTALLALKYYWY